MIEHATAGAFLFTQDRAGPRAGAGEHPLAWYASDQLAGLPMFEDSRLVATMLFATIASLSMT